MLHGDQMLRSHAVLIQVSAIHTSGTVRHVCLKSNGMRPSVLQLGAMTVQTQVHIC